MKLNYTYLKNNGLYQSRLERLIYENNVTIRVALEVYNLFYGCEDPQKLKHNPIFQEYYQTLGELVPTVKNLLGSYCKNEFEYLLDLVIEHCWQARYTSLLTQSKYR